MTIEYRPARPEEMPRFVHTDLLSFGNSTAPESIDRVLAMAWVRPEWTLCAFEDGEPVAQMGTIPFVMRWNGRDVGCGGVTDVGTLPTHRRQGHLRRLMTQAFADMRAANQPVAMLWASMAAIYQRFGYGIAHTRWSYDFDPRTVRFVDEIATPGRLRLVESQEAWPRICSTYERFAAPRTLTLRREEQWWQRVVVRQWRAEMPPILLALYEEDGEVLGYVTYYVEHPLPAGSTSGPDQRIEVRDLVWLTPAAHRALVRYLAGYDLVFSIHSWRTPVDDPLFYQVEEPRLLNARAFDGTLVRIVDLPAALEARGFDADGRLRFSFADDLCPWNTGSWELEVEGGCGRVRRTDAEPELSLTSRSLAMLASGYQSATALARMAVLPAAESRALCTADALFRTAYAPVCVDAF
jgi:predicted acetyltransferase